MLGSVLRLFAVVFLWFAPAVCLSQIWLGGEAAQDRRGDGHAAQEKADSSRVPEPRGRGVDRAAEVTEDLSRLPASRSRALCARCHPKESNGFEQTAMARSLALADHEPEGSFEHAFSHTRFTIRDAPGGLVQTLERNGKSETVTLQFAIGSGQHALGFLAEVDGHLFQSPLSYYSARHQWDVAPGYEQDPAPDFARPVTPECLECHSGAVRHVQNTLDSYADPPFAAMGITCDRCHGDTATHLRNPVPGSILNPEKLPGAARDSICEQCHLAGEVRVPNPGKAITDFRPGAPLEETFTVYVTQHGPEDTVKVISQAEQLALSVCKRTSGAKMWCGSCHDPHEQPREPVAYFRERCLTCHGTTLARPHAAQMDCIGCHMPKLPAKDGGHTAFTDHFIRRYGDREGADGSTKEPLVAWRQPVPDLRDRNLALALVTTGTENQNSNDVIRGFRMLNRLPRQFQHDPDVMTAVGTILLTAKQPEEAAKRFDEALQLRPGYAPYEVNLASALIECKRRDEAIGHLQHALQLDPLLQKAITLLASAYGDAGEDAKAAQVLQRYREAMGIRIGATDQTVR